MDFYSLGFPSLIHEHFARHRLTDEHVLVLRMPLDQAPAKLEKNIGGPLLVQRCNGTAAGLGYLEVNGICPCKSPHGAVDY
jgi:hypothetical protein